MGDGRLAHKFSPSCRTEYIENIEISHVYMCIYIDIYG